MNWREKQNQLRDCNLAWIQELGVEMKTEGGIVSVKIMDRKIDFYPFSDTYFLHSKQKYGVGIADLCRKIKALQAKSEA